MKKKEMEEVELNSEGIDFVLDDSAVEPALVEVSKKEAKPKSTTSIYKNSVEQSKEAPVNCLRKERIIVRFLVKKSGVWGDNPKHVLSGGMSGNSSRVFSVPRLSSGVFVNVLTNDEKNYLEDALGLEYNALSVHKKVDNFWDDSNDNGINKVRLLKQDNYFDLSDPEDYIRYKVLLANKDFIAPSIQAYQDYPKATYQYVIISENEENKVARGNMSATMQCYKEFGKVENDFATLRVIIETMDGRPVAASSKIEFLQTKANELIQKDSKMFLKIITDPMLQTKVLIKSALEAGIITARGSHLHLRSDGTPLCDNGEEPTLSVAAKFLNSPKHQDILFAIQAKLK